MKGSGKIVYNYVDLNEFASVNVEEQLVDDLNHHVYVEMMDTNHEEDDTWLHDATYQ